MILHIFGTFGDHIMGIFKKSFRESEHRHPGLPMEVTRLTPHWSFPSFWPKLDAQVLDPSPAAFGEKAEKFFGGISSENGEISGITSIQYPDKLIIYT